MPMLKLCPQCGKLHDFNAGRCQAGRFKMDTQAVRFRNTCLLYTSDAADERSSVDLGGRRVIKKQKKEKKKEKNMRLS